MGKKSRKTKKVPELLSTPVNASNEFEGLVSFEELPSCTFLQVNKQGEIEREVWEDGKIIKQKAKKKNKKGKEKGGKAKKNGNEKTNADGEVEIKDGNGKTNADEEVERKEAVHGASQTNSSKRKITKGNNFKNKKARYDSTAIQESHKTAKNVDVSEWERIFVPPEVLQALKELGFSTPTEIQTLALPAAIRGRMDIIGAAETGSGKTLAFGIPIINGILRDKKDEAERGNISDDDSGVEESDEEDCEEMKDEFDVNEEEESEIGDDNDEIDDEDLENVEEIGMSPFLGSDDDPFIGSDDEMDSNGGDGEGDISEELGCVKVVDNANFDFLEEDKPGKKVSLPLGLKPMRALIVTPTRELAIQVKNHIAAVLVHTDIKIAVVVGGLASEKQSRILSKGPDIVVGTPGRLWELIEQGNEHLNQIENIRYLAIDETDRMVEKGHFEELQMLLERINRNEEVKTKRQNFVFSATLTLVHSTPKRLKGKKRTNTMTSELKVKQLAKMIGLKGKPKIIDVTRKFGTAESLTESRINCGKTEKDLYLYYFLKQYPGRTLVFCNSIDCVRRLQNLFTLLQCQPVSLHASMHQKQRLKSLERFTSHPKALLLATDVAARGLDIPKIQHVIHYQTPRTAETYIHRSGRTARATQEGLSVLFIDSTELSKYRQLCTTLNRSSDLPPFPVDLDIMEQVRRRLNFARKLETQEHALRKQRAETNWINKIAKEAELLVESEEDDDDMDERIHKDMMAAREKRELQIMKSKLNKMLSLPLLSSNFSGKYPTQTGSLVSPLELGKQTTVEGDSEALSAMKKESVAFSKLVKSVKKRAPKEKKVNKKKFKGFDKRRKKEEKKQLENAQSNDSPSFE